MIVPFLCDHNNDNDISNYFFPSEPSDGDMYARRTRTVSEPKSSSSIVPVDSAADFKLDVLPTALAAVILVLFIIVIAMLILIIVKLGTTKKGEENVSIEKVYYIPLKSKSLQCKRIETKLNCLLLLLQKGCAELCNTITREHLECGLLDTFLGNCIPAYT